MCTVAFQKERTQEELQSTQVHSVYLTVASIRIDNNPVKSAQHTLM